MDVSLGALLMLPSSTCPRGLRGDLPPPCPSAPSVYACVFVVSHLVCWHSGGVRAACRVGAASNSVRVVCELLLSSLFFFPSRIGPSGARSVCCVHTRDADGWMRHTYRRECEVPGVCVCPCVSPGGARRGDRYWGPSRLTATGKLKGKRARPPGVRYGNLNTYTYRCGNLT
jgi:hypothetical protein